MSSLRAVLARYLRRLPCAVPDRVLLAAHADGDPDAFRALVERHGPMVLRLCRRLLGDAHAADDAFQATFLILARRAHRLRRPDALAAWLFGVARRVALKARTAAARRQRHEAQVRPPGPPDPLDELTARELLDALDEELARLPESYRLPLLLVYWQGLTQAEAARRLGWTPGSVKGRLERGRAKLAQRLTCRGFAPNVVLAAPLTAIVVPRELLAATVTLAADPWSKALPAAVLTLAATTTASKLVPATVLTSVLVGAGLIGLAAGVPQKADPPPHPQPALRDPQPEAPRLDRFGDPLPAGALLRLGTVRFRADAWICGLARAPDGQTLAVVGYG